jgi:hypothetical protein
LDICTSGFNAAKIPLRSPPAKLSAGFCFSKMLRRRQVLERARQFPARRGTAGFFFRHRRIDINSRRASDQFEN